MFRKTHLASAVGAITAAALATVPVQAQDDEAGASEDVEEIVVTGSRIRRAVDDAPTPVTVIERAEIDLTGLETVADILRSTSYNSFGSFRERSGSSFGQVALIDLRGLGEDRTAVLINGRRVPGNPFLGSAAVNLNSIPLAAIERIEILTDSASAVYGTDALGGVVNVILRNDFDGAEMQIGTANPQLAGAEEDNLSFMWGSTAADSNLMFTAEWFHRNPIFDGHRDYSKVDVRDPGDGTRPNLGVDTTGVSAGGNTAFHPWFAAAEAIGDCPTDVYAGIVEDPFGIPGTACGFGYADISAQTGGLDRISTWLTGNYEWTPGHELFVENRFSRQHTFGRYAPAVGFFSVPADSPHNPFDTSLDSYPKGADGVPLDFSMFHRFVAHGPRDDDTLHSEFDTLVGAKGDFNIADNGINYEAYARFYRYEAAEEGETYILQSQVEEEVKNGTYNLTNPLSRDPVNLAAVGRMAATLYRDILTDSTSAGITFDGFAWNLPAGPVGWAAGAETASEEYMDDYDSFREAGNILGSAGNSSSGDRSRWAAFGEVSIPALTNLELSVAGRFDSYDDFGEAFSPQAAVRYTPFDMLVLRASWGEGFKAPNLTNLYSARSQSFNDTTDTFRCEAIGIDPCPTNQVENFSGGNPLLEAESAQSLNVGVVVEPLDSLSVSLDYYEIEIEDVVTLLGIQTALRLENEGVLPPGVVVRRGAPTQPGDPGALVSIDRVFANLAIREVKGLDLRAQYVHEFDWATLDLRLEGSRIEKYNITPSPGEDQLDILGTEGSPQNRATFKARLMRDAYILNYEMYHIGKHRGPGDGRYPLYSMHNVTLEAALPWGGQVTLGVRNFTNEEPAYDDVNGYDDTYVLPLYDVAGRTPFIKYRHTF